MVNRKVNLRELLIFLYFCGLSGHKRGAGFDAVFCRATFFAVLLYELIILPRISNENRTIRLKGEFVKYAAFVCYYYFSVVWCNNIGDVFYAAYISYFIQILVMMLIFTNRIHTSDEAVHYLKLLLWSLVYMLFWLIIRTPTGAWGSERVGLEMGLNENDLGMRCAIATVLCLYFAEKKKLYYVLAAVFAIVAMFTGSRKAFLMIMMGIALYLIFKEKGFKFLLNVMLFIGAALILWKLAMTNEMFYQVLGRRLEKAFNTLRGVTMYKPNGEVIVDYSSVERAWYREYGFSMFKTSPLFGYGANGFVTEMRRIGYRHVAYSHCNYVELLATLGSIGFVLYYRIQLQLLFKSIKKFIKTRNHLMVLVATIIMINLFAEYYYVSYISVFIQIVIALLYIAVDKDMSSEIVE